MKKRLLTVLTVLFAFVLGLSVLTACGGTMDISESEITLAIGETRTLTATDPNGEEITWTSSDDTIVTIQTQVAKRGIAIVQALKGGTATLTAKSKSGASVTCKVTVENIVVEIGGTGVAAGKLQMERFSSQKLTATVKKDGQALSDGVKWSSEDDSIVSVAEDGTVTANSEGITHVYATRDGGSSRGELEVTVVWAAKPAGWYALHDWEQNKITPNTWGYWVDAGYEPQYNTNVKVTNAEYLGDPTGTGLVAGGVTMTYENTLTGANEHGVQLFYRSSKGYNDSNAGEGFTPYDASKLLLEVGAHYVLKMDITVTASGTITVNGTQINVVANEKQAVEAPFLHDDDGRIHDAGDYANVSSAVYVMMGANGTMIQKATVKLENVRWEAWDGQKSKLEAPTIAVSGKNVTITDSNTIGVKSYTVGLFEKGAAADAEPIRVATTDSKSLALDDAKWPNGDYELRARADAKDGRYEDSAWSAGVAYTVSHGPIQYNLKEGGSADAKADLSDTYYYYTEGATVESATYNDGTITLKYSGNSSWTAMQLFYKNPALKAGTQYTLTFTLNSPVGGKKIRINGSMFGLVEGDNAIEVTYAEGSGADGLSVNIQFGEPTADYQGTTDKIEAGTFTLKDFVWTKYEAPAGTLLNGGEKDAVDNPGTFYLWWDQGNWNGSLVTMKESSIREEEKIIHFSYTATGDDKYGSGVQLFYELPGAITGNEYTITLTIKVSVDCTIRVCGQAEEFKAGVERTVTITKNEADGNEGATLSVIMGTYGDNGPTNVKEADVTVSNWKIEGETQEPTKPVDPADLTFGPDILPSSTAMVNSGKGDNGHALDTFMYWYVQDTSWNCGSVVTLNTHTYANDTITLGYQGGDKNFSVQLFYANSALTAGKMYKISFTVTTTKDMSIIVNGKEFALKAGEATKIEHVFTLASNALDKDAEPWAVDIQMPGMSEEVTVTISGLKWNEGTQK